MLARTPRGRVATAAAWRHLRLEPPADAAALDPGPTLFDP
jgi:holliday junction DNA helicase RuvB